MVASKSKSAAFSSVLPKDLAMDKRFALVVSRYHESIAGKLLEAATSTLEAYGAKAAHMTTIWAPGSFELPLLARIASQYHNFDAILCLGVIVKGETPHYDYIAQTVSQGIAQLGYQLNIPVIFGVLTTLTMDQAEARAGGSQGNEDEAAEAALALLHSIEQLKTTSTGTS